MLKQAILYSEQLKQKYIEAMCDDYFKFFNGGSYTSFNFDIAMDNWYSIQKVSVDTKGNIIGYISCEINRDTRNINGFGLMNFTKQPSLIFAKDILQFLRELRDNHNANRIGFVAYIGSDAEKMYSKFIDKHGGRVVGIENRVQKLSDGKYYDSKIFEILREDMNF